MLYFGFIFKIDKYDHYLKEKKIKKAFHNMIKSKSDRKNRTN